jgi:uncharacterized protein with von Willebrand factor type A (vWA) domain
MAGISDFDGARDHVVHEVVRFTRRLRTEGVDVAATAALPAVEALVTVGFDDRGRARTALFAALVTDPADSDAFDDAFDTFWYRLRTGLAAAASPDEDDGGTTEEQVRADVAPPSRDGDTRDTVEEDIDGGGPGAGRVADVDDRTADETADHDRAGAYSEAGTRSGVGVASVRTGGIDHAALSRFESALASLAGRRWRRATDGDAVDARRAIRRSLDTGGVTMELPRRDRRESAFRTTLLVDVSRSVLDAIDRRYLLDVVAALVADGRDVRAFFFDTDLREVTGAFETGNREPVEALVAAEVDWGGGTQIGESFCQLRREHPEAVDRRTAVVVVSDGLDVGDVDVLEREMAGLARRGAAVVWLNPLAASPSYEPTCRGMAAALPFVDGLFAFASDDDLAEIARQLDRHGPRGPVGYRQDFRDREVTTT